MATELAKAYVQIVPSTRGIQGSISQALGGEAAAAGKSAGSSIVGAIRNAIVTAGIGKALAATLTEGADLEQSIGGIETLFGAGGKTLEEYAESVGKTVTEAAGKYNILLQSQKTMLDNADKAYATAGLSANEYMQQVTGFSATLLQGLGGDTQAAARIADQALVQMADNANKMGTDMTFIQNAYQGFAKDNYEMLDNLKLGYGGTQAEMARLINDSGVLGDSIEVTAETVKDVPFDKIIQAIGVIQDDLGITGTTAQEAATTLSGSFAAMAAAGKNVLAALTLGQDLGPALEALAQTFTTWLTGNQLPAVWNILSALPGAMVNFVQALAPQLTAGIQTFLPQIMSTGTQLVQNLGAGLVQGIPSFLSQALPMVLQFTDSLRANFGSVVDAGIDLLLNLVQGIMDSLPTLIAYVPQIVSNIAGLVNDNAPKLSVAAGKLILMLIQGLIAAVPSLLANMGNIIKAVADVIMAINWINLGSTVIRAIGSGLKSMAGGLSKIMGETFEGALDYIKGLPKMALQWGRDMIQGFISGITGSIGGVIDAVKNVGSTIASYLHFSRPDIGPLRMYEQWMPDMMRGLARGITENMHLVTDAVDQLNNRMAAPLQASALQAAIVAGARWAAPVAAAAPAAVGVTLYQTIHTHDSLSPAELTREAENFLRRARWKNP